MEDIVKLLKVFIENHFLPTIGAIVLALVTILAIPSNNWMIAKIGDIWFKVLLFCCYFLLIKFITYVRKTFPEKIAKTKYKKEQLIKQQDEAAKSWQNVFDHLTAYELDLVKELVQKNNNPVRRDYMFGPGMPHNLEVVS